MSQQDVKAPLAHDPWQQPPHPPGHLLLGILVDPIVVAHRASQAQNAQSIVFIEVSIDADAAQRRLLLIAVVVVAPDIEHGTVCKGGQKREVAGLPHPRRRGSGQFPPACPGCSSPRDTGTRSRILPESSWVNAFLQALDSLGFTSSWALGVSSSKAGMRPST